MLREQHLKRYLIIMPEYDIFDTHAIPTCHGVVIQRNLIQCYFVKELHNRFHFDVGQNGVDHLLNLFNSQEIEHIIVPNDVPFYLNEEKKSVINRTSYERHDSQILKKVKGLFQDIIKTCPNTIKQHSTIRWTTGVLYL